VKSASVSKVATDTLALVLSSGAATLFQGITTFGLSKLLTTADFGAWREFVLCGTFVGVLHLGFADGLQVAWCSPARDRRAPTLGSGVRVLLSIQGAWVAVGLGLGIVAWRVEPFPFFFPTVGLFALTWNTSTALQFYAQCRERFGQLSTFVILYPALLLAGVAVLVVAHAATPLHLALAACAAAGLSSLALRARDARADRDATDPAPRLTARETIGLGLPILALNNAMIGMANFDKVAAGLLFPPRVFATYAFASVLVVFIGSAIGAGSRVLLPAFARQADAGTLETATTTSTTASLLAWSVALIGYFPAAAVVGRFLPKYVPALPLARSLFVASLFLALPQVVHMNACRALRIERTYLKWTGWLLAGALVAAWFVGRGVGLEGLAPLAIVVGVAWSASGALLLKRRGTRTYTGRAIAATIWCAVWFTVATWALPPWRAAAVYILAAVPLWSIAGARARRRFHRDREPR